MRAYSLVTTSLTAFFLTTVSVSAVLAADLKGKIVQPAYVPVMPTVLPAVSGLNWKFEGAGGGQWGNSPMQDRAGGYGLVQVALPLGTQWGAQADVQFGSARGEAFGGAGGHVFWRDPNTALFGAYGEGFTTNVDTGRLTKGRIGPEVELYLNRFNVSAIAGYEWGNQSIRDGFFVDSVLSYFATDDLRLYAGGNYGFAGAQGRAGVEYQLPQTYAGGNVSVFAEARLGEGGYKSAFAGVKIGLGAPNKSLIRRYREDDPLPWINQGMHDAAQATAKGKFKTDTPTETCASGTHLYNGYCVSNDG